MNPQFPISNAITQDWARVEQARGFLEAAQLSEQWVRQMSDRALLLAAYHTTHIEGTRLTLGESELLLSGQAVPEADADDVSEVIERGKQAIQVDALGREHALNSRQEEALRFLLMQPCLHCKKVFSHEFHESTRIFSLEPAK